MRALALALGFAALPLTVAGCDHVFDLAKVKPDARGTGTDAADVDADVDAMPPICLEEHFTNNVRLTEWQQFGMSRNVMITLANEEATFEVPADTGQHPYGGLYTDNRDLTSIWTEMEVITPPPAANDTELAMQLTSDSTHFHAFTVQRGRLLMQYETGGTSPTKVDTAFDANAHRFLRMRHLPATSEIAYDVRSAGGTWTELKRWPAPASLAGYYFEIYSGSYGTTSVSNSTIDNIVLTGTCPL